MVVTAEVLTELTAEVLTNITTDVTAEAVARQED